MVTKYHYRMAKFPSPCLFIQILSWFYPDFILILSNFSNKICINLGWNLTKVFFLTLSRFYPTFIKIIYQLKLYPNFIVIICIWIRSWDEFDTKSGSKDLNGPFCTIWLIFTFQKSSGINHSFQIFNSNFVLIQNKVIINDGNSWKMSVQVKPYFP